MKTREDLDRYRAVIAASRPDVVLECGTWHGGSARWFAELGVDVVTIDIAPTVDDGAHHGRVTYLVGDSVDPTVVAAATSLCEGRRTMVVLDSDHAPDHVRREIEAYGDAVTPGCYLVVEDGVIRYVPSGFPVRQAGPLDAVESHLVGDPRWRRDRATEDMHPVSMHPMGWWQRRE